MVAKSISHQLETMVETRPFVGIYGGIDSFPGFRGGAKWISSTPKVLQKKKKLGDAAGPASAYSKLTRKQSDADWPQGRAC